MEEVKLNKIEKEVTEMDKRELLGSGFHGPLNEERAKTSIARTSTPIAVAAGTEQNMVPSTSQFNNKRRAEGGAEKLQQTTSSNDASQLEDESQVTVYNSVC